MCLEMVPKWCEYIVEIADGDKAMGNIIIRVITTGLKSLRAAVADLAVKTEEVQEEEATQKEYPSSATTRCGIEFGQQQHFS
jgi:hypothetical protein